MVKRVVETKLAKGATVFTKSPLQRSLMNILLNLSAESREANYLMDGKPELKLKNGNPLFKKIIKIAIETLDIGLLKVVNNATYFCKPEYTKNIMKGAVLPIRDAITRLVNEEQLQNPQAVFELLSILGNCVLEELWEGFMDKTFFVVLTQLITYPHPNIKLQSIILVGQLSQNSELAQLFKKKAVYGHIIQEFNKENREQCFQFLYVMY